jgi:tetratricopeptide (TPR) repeat protein
MERVMTVTTVIRIEERENQSSENQPYAAHVSFDDGVSYPCQIRDPFAEEPQQEAELEWYFEEYLTFPFVPEVRARDVAESVRDYGKTLFMQVFADPQALDQYRQAIESGLHTIQLEIAGSLSFHRLHWEALYDPKLHHALALHAPIIRRNREQQTWTAEMKSSTTINILVVVARPAGSRDVGYRTISRPLVEELSKMPMPVSVTLLRPGTYQALDAHLEKVTRKHGVGYYHVIHFDVHGGLLSYSQFQQKRTAPSHYSYQDRFGRNDILPYKGEKAFLFLESERDERADPVEAFELAQVLLRHRIPIAILNACQSGKYIDRDKSSLGNQLVQAGIQAVLAMGYSVMVSAVERLMPVLYRELLADSNLSSALCLARKELANWKERRAFFDQKIDLEDWVLPILYQNQDVRLVVQPMTEEQATEFYARTAQQYDPPQPGYGFVGRDVDILHIEKRLLTKRNLLLVGGMGGAGKTTLLYHLASWWQRTGLVQHIFYFGYDERAWTRQQIMRKIAQELLKPEAFAFFQSRSPEVQQVQLVNLLCHAPHLLILDNLESITGTALAIRHTLSKKEQGYLHRFLSKLVKGQTLVLLGSRSAEDWLARGTFDDNRYDLGGLDPEAASLLTERILERHRVVRYRQDPDLRQLLNLLDGFPLALEVVLANLVHQTPTQILTALQTGDITLKAGESDKRTENILRCIEYSHSNLSSDAQQLLLCLAPFTSVVWRDTLEEYAIYLKQQPILEDLPFDRLGDMVQETVKWGLLSPDSRLSRFLHLQPVMPYFLRNRSASSEQQQRRIAIEKAFQDHYRNLSRSLYALIASKKADEQQNGLILTQFEYENLLTALRLAIREKASVIDLYHVLSDYLDRQQDHQRGEALDTQVLHFFATLSQEELIGSAGQEFAQILGAAANRQIRQKQYQAAMKSYQKILQILETVELDMKQRRLSQANVYHSLGTVAQEQRKWTEAKDYYQKALQIFDEYHDRYPQARTYQHLAIVAQEQHKWQEAEDYLQKALQIKREFDDPYSQARTYHELGIVAQQQRKWSEAEAHYQQASQIFVKFKDPHSLAQTSHNLGVVFQEQYKWQEAEAHYQKALPIFVKFDDRYAQANTYNQLGIVAQKQADTYSQLGTVTQAQRKWNEAEAYFQQALRIKGTFDNHNFQASTYHNLGMVAQAQRKWNKAEAYYQKALDLKGDDRYSRARTYQCLGSVAEEQRKWEEAEAYFQQALQIYDEFNDPHSKARTYGQLGILARMQHKWPEARDLLLQALSIFQRYNDTDNSALILNNLALLWQASNDASIFGRIAAILKVPQEAVQWLLQDWLKNFPG